MERDKKIYMLGYQINVFLCKRMGHLANECSLSRKAPVDVANDVPQTSVGDPWVRVIKRHKSKRLWGECKLKIEYMTLDPYLRLKEVDKIHVQALVEGSKSFREGCYWLENFHGLLDKKTFKELIGGC